MYPALALGRRDTLDTVDTRLVSEIAIGVLSSDDEGGLPIPPDLPLREVDQLDCPAPLLGVSGVHTAEVTCEESCLIPPGPGPDLDDGRTIGEGIGWGQQFPEFLIEPLVLLDQLLDLSPRGCAAVGVAPFVRSLGRASEFGAHPGQLPGHVSGRRQFGLLAGGGT